jgi:uncharacterized protein YdcH (DUF465 family)
MHVEHHDLAHEFPEHAAAIHALTLTSARFSKLFEQYESLTNEVEELERADLPVNDVLIEEMKKQRLLLKDELYQLLVAHKG